MSSIDSNSISENNQKKSIFIKILAILSIARWYNISLITISLYAIQIFIYESSFNYLIHYQGLNLHLYILSIDLIVVGGYLINAFYDFEKDMINQPSVEMIAIINQNFSNLLFHFLNPSIIPYHN